MNGLIKTPADDLRWGWKALILILGTLLFGIILSSLLMAALTIGYSSQGLAQEQALEKATIEATRLEAQVFISVLQLVFMLWLVRWVIRRVEKQPFEWSKLGLIQHENKSWQLSLGALLAIAITLSVIGIGLIAGTLQYLGNGFKLFSPAQVINTLVLAMVLSLASGFGEEIVFRGYLQSRIAERYNPTTAVFIVAILFALSHPVVEVEHPLFYLATAALVGILFGLAFVRTRSLWMGIALHTVWNYLQIAVVAIRNGADGRFLGYPLFLFDRLAPVPQMFVEFGVILIGLFLVFWMTKPGRKWIPVSMS